ncbi:uncharacterized protein LOC109815677 [Cajanus cajan]|nr:uncharacterized protein LOC109815677 [Cajanus cajan]
MDAVVSTPFGPNKNRRMKKNGGGNTNRCENLNTYAGLLNPPSRAMSFSYSHPLSPYSYSSSLLVQQQPPLLPLPHVSRNPSTNNKTRSRHLSLKATKKSINRDSKELPTLLVGLGNMEDDHVVWGSVFNLAPPPSSLPLPKFTLRSKLACNAEAAASGGGVDDGATNNLRRLLRLR